MRFEDSNGNGKAKDFYRNRRVLVVGGDGFLGMNALRMLHGLGAKISILSRRERPRAFNIVDRVFHGALECREVVAAAVKDQDVVFDLAGVGGAVGSNRQPFQSLRDECGPQLNLLQSCAESTRRPMIVFCSTRLVYGAPEYLPVHEKHPLAPQSMYAVHKLTVENYVRVLSRTSGLPYCIFRLSNPYGPLQERDRRGYGVINQFIHLAADGQEIRLYGDGQQIRDYIFVEDTVEAFLLAPLEPRAQNEILNLGGREPITLRAAVETIVQQSGKGSVTHVPWPADAERVETGDYCSDLTKVDQLLGPRRNTSFAEGVRLTLQSMHPGRELSPRRSDKQASDHIELGRDAYPSSRGVARAPSKQP